MDKPTYSLKNSFLIALLFTLALWWIKLCELFFGLSLASFGVYPLSLSGLLGIVLAPVIHGSLDHVISNTLPVLTLATMLFYGYPRSRGKALAMIWILSGIGVWCFGRENYHIGASGIAHGMFFYLFIIGILRGDKRSSALLMVAFYLYGGMLFSIFPSAAQISFEYHFFGAVAGVFCAVLFRNLDPISSSKRYDWQDQDEQANCPEDALIGEQWRDSDEHNNKQ